MIDEWNNFVSISNKYKIQGFRVLISAKKNTFQIKIWYTKYRMGHPCHCINNPVVHFFRIPLAKAKFTKFKNDISKEGIHYTLYHNPNKTLILIS